MASSRKAAPQETDIQAWLDEKGETHPLVPAGKLLARGAAASPPRPEQELEPAPEQPPDPHAGLVARAGEAGYLDVDLSTGALPNLIASFARVGAYQHGELGPQRIVVDVSVAQDRLVANTRRPQERSGGEREYFKPPPDQRVSRSDEGRAWLDHYLTSLREGLQADIPCLLILNEEVLAFLEPPDANYWLTELALDHKAIVAVLRDQPGYRPGNKQQAQLNPLDGVPAAEEVEN
jgi:hypothetical protein